MVKGYYKCECGKEFDNPQKFNGHKSRCTIHHKSIGNYNEWLEHENALKEKRASASKNYYKALKEESLSSWISEQHVCERCGKIMTQKYGSGRFCSKQCANSRKQTEITKNKISNRLKTNHSRIIPNKVIAEINYNNNPKNCVICGEKIPYEFRNRKTCGKKCYIKVLCIQSEQRVINNGGNINPHPNKNCKCGTYRGIKCDSSYELAFVVYNIDLGKTVCRCTEKFPYYYNGKKHLYYPDFIVDDTIYEIKNYYNDLVEAKANSIPHNVKYKLLLKEDMKFYPIFNF